MARNLKNRQRIPYIIVFWEGESEEQYMRFLRERFHENVNLTVHGKKGVFDTAKKSFSMKGSYHDEIDYIDEIWLVFDTELELRTKWDEYWQIVTSLRKKCKNAKVKLFMTKGCIEYFFLLHYEKSSPMIVTPADKEQIIKKLSSEHYCPGYKKGDKDSTWRIAERYEAGIINGDCSLKRIKEELEGAKTEDDRAKILFFTDSTFTNTHEAVQHLIKFSMKN